MSTELPMLSIIIVNWNTSELLQACIKSIKTHTQGVEYELIIADNGSSDHSVEAIKQSFAPDITSGKIKLIANSENKGFAAAVNQGIAQVRGSYILLLNPDTYLVDNAFGRMLEFMDQIQPEQAKQTAIIGPKITYPDGTLQPSCRRFPTLASQLLILLKIHNIWPNLKPLRSYFMSDMDYSKTQEVDQVMGACFLIKKSALEQIGLFDEQFFIWFEEVDYCKRAKEKGFNVVYLATAHIVHYKGKSFSQVESPKKQRYINNSLLHYMNKHGSPLAAGIIALMYPISMLLSFAVHALQLSKPDKDL